MRENQIHRLRHLNSLTWQKLNSNSLTLQKSNSNSSITREQSNPSSGLIVRVHVVHKFIEAVFKNCSSRFTASKKIRTALFAANSYRSISCCATFENKRQKVKASPNAHSKQCRNWGGGLKGLQSFY